MKHIIISALVSALVSLVAVVGVALVVHPGSVQLGSLTGPDIPSPYLRWGGVTKYNATGTIKTATTTVCAMQSPNATSTLEFAGARIDTSSTTATTWTIAKSATAYATTTVLASNLAVSGGAQGFLIASTTIGADNSTLVIAPNQWIVVSETGGITAGDSAGTGFVPSGLCQASFIAY